MPRRTHILISLSLLLTLVALVGLALAILLSPRLAQQRSAEWAKSQASAQSEKVHFANAARNGTLFVVPSSDAVSTKTPSTGRVRIVSRSDFAGIVGTSPEGVYVARSSMANLDYLIYHLNDHGEKLFAEIPEEYLPLVVLDTKTIVTIKQEISQESPNEATIVCWNAAGPQTKETARIDIEGYLGGCSLCAAGPYIVVYVSHSKSPKHEWILVDSRKGEVVRRANAEQPGGLLVASTSPNGQYAVGLAGNSIEIREIPSLRHTGKFDLRRCDFDDVTVVAVSSSGRYVALYSVNGQGVWDSKLDRFYTLSRQIRVKTTIYTPYLHGCVHLGFVGDSDRFLLVGPLDSWFEWNADTGNRTDSGEFR